MWKVSPASPTTAQLSQFVTAIHAAHIADLLGRSWPVQTAGGTLITVLLTWAITLYRTRRRVAWRVYTDDEFRLDRVQAEAAGESVSLKIEVNPTDNPGPPVPVAKPWLVVLRIRNSGFAHLRKDYFDPPVRFSFPGREVRHAEIIDKTDGADANIEVIKRTDTTPGPQQSRLRKLAANWLPPGVTALLGIESPAPVIESAAGGIELNDLVLNRNARLTLMAVLSGDPPEVPASGRSRDDGKKIKRDRGVLVGGGHIVAEQPRRGPGSRSLAFGGGITLTLAGLLLGLFLSAPGTSTTAPCAGGTLTLIGSTAFSPVARQVAAAYSKSCATARIAVPNSNNGSLNGLATLARDGRQGKTDELIAMSDGPAPPGPQYAGLVGQPVAIIIFTVTVNTGIGIYNLTTDQVRNIFHGTVTNWNAITHGPSIPIRIISRDRSSGTRRAFDQYVLGGTGESTGTASACTGQNLPSAPVIWCTDTTTKLLQVVADIPGAIGYAQIGDVAAYSGGGVQAVALDGLDARFGDIGRTRNTYKFWTAEYLYTYGQPSALASAFLASLGSPAAVSDLKAAGYTPCRGGGTSRLATLCAVGNGFT
jgi:ABC-type phosphate transport system substrate-binding protein